MTLFLTPTAIFQPDSSFTKSVRTPREATPARRRQPATYAVPSGPVSLRLPRGGGKFAVLWPELLSLVKRLFLREFRELRVPLSCDAVSNIGRAFGLRA